MKKEEMKKEIIKNIIGAVLAVPIMYILVVAIILIFG